MINVLKGRRGRQGSIRVIPFEKDPTGYHWPCRWKVVMSQKNAESLYKVKKARKLDFPFSPLERNAAWPKL